MLTLPRHAPFQCIKRMTVKIDLAISKDNHRYTYNLTINEAWLD